MLKEVVAAGDIYAAVRFCIENKLNMIVSEDTSTGKTVAARKIRSYVGDGERIGIPPLKWSSAMFRKTEEDHGKQAIEA